ncbi:thiamine-phosphate kinase [Bailinhaonella thermotolerans]|uniref:Thiamine-monophosphate kinase n=1 Tax=Bailinhaonella thermotolerans TaxID=1070861 RepID=A0A3A4AE56_9ACTN|nr:thiamine-phosphate kinase [Bailinhaonella thermotolerans]RJL25047.1 thiamine-phosphate kinase [Bailinhaonella thermotolerans]
MGIGELGEFGVVSRVTARFPQGDDVLIGPGDDAAVLRAPDGRVVVTTDLLVEGRHFRRDWSGPYDVGRKAAAQNLADVAAMGARPTGLFVGLGVPGDVAAEWLDALADGLRDECALVGASVSGGDVVRADSVVLGVTAIGDLEGRRPVTRSGAAPGQVVAVAGRLGWAAGGLALLLAGRAGPRELVEAHRRPEPPYGRAAEAVALGATAMLDVSDGLLQDLGHIAAASGVGIDLDPGAFPVPAALAEAGRELGEDPLTWILTGGEDHALAAVFPAGAALPEGWLEVGVTRAGRDVTVAGREYEAAGWDHFR